MKPNTIRRIVGAAALAALTAGTASAQNLTGAGATFPYPIYSKWFTSTTRRPASRSTQSIGSGGGSSRSSRRWTSGRARALSTTA
jgi:phosphate transport system substrate-binding protein